MNYRNPLIALSMTLLLGLNGTAIAGADTESAEAAAEAELQAQLEAEYKKALSQAEQQISSASSFLPRIVDNLECDHN